MLLDTPSKSVEPAKLSTQMCTIKKYRNNEIMIQLDCAPTEQYYKTTPFMEARSIKYFMVFPLYIK